MPRPIIWPLMAKLCHPVFLQKRPIWTGGLRIPSLPVLPWNNSTRPPAILFGQIDYSPIAADVLPVGFGQCAIGPQPAPLQNALHPQHPRLYFEQFHIPSVVRLTPPQVFFQISGQTKNSSGVALGGCVVRLYRTIDDAFIETTTSNADGYFYFKSPVQAATHYAVAYLAGAPDVTGTTVNTLVGA